MRRWLPRLGLVLVLALAALGPLYVMHRHAEENGSKTISLPLGNATIGGPFTLIDGNTGRTVTDATFHGKLMLIYFGYTYCPDICPTTLSTIARALDLLGPDADKLTPVFVSVDPARDTAEKMKAYVANFSPRLVGLTGSPAAIAQAAKEYHVYYRRVGEGKDYLIDHSSIMYLMGPDGAFLTDFGHGTTAQALAAGIRKYLPH